MAHCRLKSGAGLLPENGTHQLKILSGVDAWLVKSGNHTANAEPVLQQPELLKRLRRLKHRYRQCRKLLQNIPSKRNTREGELLRIKGTGLREK